MKPWRTGSHHHTIQVLLQNIFPDALLARFGTGIRYASGDLHVRHTGRHAGHFLAIDGFGDIHAAVTDVNADAGFGCSIFQFIHDYCLLCSYGS